MDSLNEILASWADGVIKKIQGNMASTGTNASGETSKSLEYTVDGGEITIYGRQYFQGVEQGRPGGKVPERFQDVIRKWMDDKDIASQFGNTESEKRSAAWFIANFIKENGTQLYRQGGREDIYTNVINEELPKLEQWLVTYVSGTLTDTLDKGK